MKILIVCSGNSGSISPFIKEQVDSIIKLGVEVEIYSITGKGIFGYLRNLPTLKNKIKNFKPNLIHAHYGLSGLVSCLQTTVPVVITFHGSDAYINYVKILSKIAARLSAFNIFVEGKIKDRIKDHKKYSIIPCGVNLDNFSPMGKKFARDLIGLDSEKKYILFSSSFDNDVKNYDLAKCAIQRIKDDIKIIELKNKTRAEVNLLFNACDLALLTSKSEGSPQFIKEAMACNCPIVATDVGDIRELIGDIEGCYITSFNPDDAAAKIKSAIDFSNTNGRTKGRETILHLDNKFIAKSILAVYQQVQENR